MRVSFADSKFKDAINAYVRILNGQSHSGDFEKYRNQYISYILKSISNNPYSWDKRTPFNGGYISEQLLIKLNEASMVNSEINQIYSMLLRFFIEEYINNPTDVYPEYQKIRSFSYDHMNLFGEEPSEQIHYALSEMNTSILRSLMISEDLSSIKEAGNLKKIIEDLHSQWNEDLEVKSKKIHDLNFEWQNELNEKEERVRQLQEALDSQRNAFNFVGLYSGFESLGQIKKGQLKWAKFFLILLGVLLPLVIIAESISFYGSQKEIKSLYDFMSLLPAASLTIILVYYFRISLGNYNSIRAQIMQIDLRKSLCQFIQSYAEYSSGIKSTNSSLLDKFEDIVFSNIMSSEDKIPSTFDGVEQIATLITALKGKSS
ncbi:hypothetical protein ACVLVH_003446 [Kluyvera sp. 1366]